MLCIPPSINRKLKEAVANGNIKIDKLIKMSSEDRAALLEKYVGKNYVESINKQFVNKFNTEVTPDVMTDIVNTLSKVNELRSKEPVVDTATWLKMDKAPEWARMYAELQDRMNVAVNPGENKGIREGIKSDIKTEYQKIKDQTTAQAKALQALKSGYELLTTPVVKSLKASMDLSYALRQGFKVFIKSPEQWGKSMSDAFQFIKNTTNKNELNALMTEFKAKYYAHPNYEALVNDGKLAFGVVEDWFPTAMADKIPLIGNLFKASNDAFTVFSQSARFGIANDLLEKQMALKGGQALTKEELQSIGYIANSITGRGSLGKFETIAGPLNKLLFSARYISSQVDVFTMPFKSTLSPFARKEALQHSTKTLAMIGSLMTTAAFFTDVEFDPRSSHFGKMKVGKNWIDLTAGIGSYMVLATKMATGQSKSTSNNKIVKLNSGNFGSQTRTDVGLQWFEGKLAPVPSLVDQIVGKGQLYGGKKPTLGNVAVEIVSPISVNNVVDFSNLVQKGEIGGYLGQEDKTAGLIAAMADILGAGVTPPRNK